MGISTPVALAVLGSFAILGSNILLALLIVISQPHSHSISAARISAIISSVLESATVVLLIWLFFTSMQRNTKITSLLFGSGVVLCVVTAALTVVTLICLAKEKTLRSKTFSFLTGASVVLVIVFATQLLYLVIRFAFDRTHEQGRSQSPSIAEIGRCLPGNHVKSIPYSRTSPPETRVASIDSRSPPSSSGGFSATETMHSLRTSFSTSKTRLLSNSQRRSRRQPSLESMSYRERSSTADESFDSWDTSSVDPQNRQTVLESTSPTPGRLLETIPASPTTSRSPSPGTPLELEPPKLRRRSRSFSPASSSRTLPLQQPRPAFTQQLSASESHIHPLFRSDSPTPPPMASPGTVVLAAAGAGRVITDRQSIRSLHSRMRSGSLPTASSPLNHHGSFEDFARSLQSDVGSLTEEPEEIASPEIEVERNVTPPLPEWVMNAGSRTSLASYFGRKQKEEAAMSPS